MARPLRPHDCARMIGVEPAMSLEFLLFDIVNVHKRTVAPPPAEQFQRYALVAAAAPVHLPIVDIGPLAQRRAAAP